LLLRFLAAAGNWYSITKKKKRNKVGCCTIGVLLFRGRSLISLFFGESQRCCSSYCSDLFLFVINKQLCFCRFSIVVLVFVSQEEEVKEYNHAPRTPARKVLEVKKNKE
jgi:hypothetical protein